MNNNDSKEYTGLEIAVIGLSGKFPGADNVEELWDILKAGKECISHFTKEELLNNGVEASLLEQENYVKSRGILNNIEYFDNDFFGFSPREAELLDPQIRIFLESAYQTLEDSGYNPFSYPGKIGLFAGASPNLYWSLGTYLSENNDFGDYANKDLLSTRVSYKLNLQGPSHTLFTACSTSLVSIHQACRSLLGGECDIALAGGVSLDLPQMNGYLSQEGMILSKDGHNRSFDKLSSGTVFSNGVGVVALKPLEDAIKDRDNIYAVIKGTAINNDGNRKVSYAAPSVKGQAEVIRDALQVAQVNPETLSYIEAHGSATNIGDPIEVEALRQALNLSEKHTCGIGSIKSNIGHSNIASGVAGFIKTVLALHKEVIPASIHFTEPNPKIDFVRSPFYVVDRLKPWPREVKPRRAGVSSFGVGGTNAHVILEEAPVFKSDTSTERQVLIPLSAKSSGSLEHYKKKLAVYLQNNDCNIKDMAYTLQVGRHVFANRSFLVCSNLTEALDNLVLDNSSIKSSFVNENIEPKIVFMFSGQSSQYVNMGRDLYNNIDAFKNEVDKGFDILNKHFGHDVREVVFPSETSVEVAEELLNKTKYTQPLLFVLEYALCQLLQSIGIKPDAMIGHSLGEYIAATIAGVLSFEDALNLVTKRAELMNSQGTGSMLAISIRKEDLLPILPKHISLAAVNNENSCVISGDHLKIQLFKQTLEELGYTFRDLRTSHAFHSCMMDDILPLLEQEVRNIKIHEPQIPYVSNLTGKWVSYEEIKKPEYWSSQLRNTVNFLDGMNELTKTPNTIYIEIGPSNTLSTFANSIIKDNQKSFVSSLLRHPKEISCDNTYLLNKLGGLWLKGVSINWNKYYASESRSRISLPTYSFDRKPFWFNEDSFKEKMSLLNQNLSKSSLKNLIYRPVWVEKMLMLKEQVNYKEDTLCVLFLDNDKKGKSLLTELKDRYSIPIIIIRWGEEYKCTSENEYDLDATDKTCVEKLLKDLKEIKNRKLDLIFCSYSKNTDKSFNDEPAQIFEREMLTNTSGYSHFIKNIRSINQREKIDVYYITGHSLDLEQNINSSYKGAFLYGASRALHNQHGDIHFKRIEIDLTNEFVNGDWHNKIIKQLCNEFHQTGEDCVMLKGGRRFVRKIDEVPKLGLSEKNELNQNIVIGEINKESLGLIEYFSSIGASIHLLCQTYFPIARKWTNWENDNLSINDLMLFIQTKNILIANDANIILKDAALKIEKKGKEEIGYEDFDEVSQRLATLLICSYFERCGIEMKKGNEYADELIIEKLQVLPKFSKFYRYFIHVLLEDNVFEISDGKTKVVDDVDTNNDIQEIYESIQQSYPKGLPIYNLVKHCVDNYKEVLSGNITGVSVLFPDGNTQLLDSVSGKNTITSSSAIRIEEVKNLTLKYIKGIKPKRKIRILEVGAGRGELTKVILPAIKNANVSYYYTDIGKTFLRHGQNLFGTDYDFIDYKHFDINKDPEVQGFDLYSFDIVLGFDVVHATPSLEHVIGNLRSLIIPGGWMLLVENTSKQRLANLVWGLTDGWWDFSDSNIRSLTPLISRKEWLNFIIKMDFEFVDTIPNSLEDNECDHSLIMMQTQFANNNNAYTNYLKRKHHLQLQEAKQNINVLSKMIDNGTNLSFASNESNTKLDVQLMELVQKSSEIDSITYFFEECEGEQFPYEHALEDLFKIRDFTQKYNVKKCFIHSKLTPYCIEEDDLIVSATMAGLTAIVSELNLITPTNWINLKYAGVCDNEDDANNMTLAISAEEYLRSLTEVLSTGNEVSGELWIANENPSLIKTKHDDNEIDKHKEVENEENADLRTNIELVICQMWNKIFGISHVNKNDSFFDLGGDSLMIVELLAKMEKLYQVKIKINEFYNNITVSLLAALIESKQNESIIHIVKSEKKEYYPTTSSQKTIFYMQMLHPESTAYNITKVIEMQDGIDVEHLVECYNAIIKRQENLRTIFKIVKGEPCQIIQDHFELKAENLLANKGDLLQKVESFIKPFDLKKNPAIRLAFLTVDDKKYMIIDIHHIICDGIAIDIFKTELADLYFGKTPEVLTLQYRDFADWQTKEVFKDRLKSQEKFWMDMFKTPVNKVGVPADYEKNSFDSHVGEHLLKVLDKELSEKIIALTKSTNTTLFSHLSATAYILLSKYSNTYDIVIGTGTKGRNYQDLDKIIGNFVNTIAMRCHPSKEKTYIQFLSEVKHTVNESIENQDFKYEELISKLPYNLGKKDKSLFNLAVTLVTQSLVDQNEESGSTLFKRYVEYFDKTSKFDIDINAVENNGEISLLIEYSASLYKPETIQAFINGYINTLQTVVANPQVLLEDIPFETSSIIRNDVITRDQETKNKQVSVEIHS